MNRRGFALLATLWLITAMGAVALSASLSARDAAAATRNRLAATRALWRAEGCAERVRSRLDRALEDPAAWMKLDRHAALGRLPRFGCNGSLRTVGSALDINTANAERLTVFMLGAGLRPRAADSAAQIILDWRDADADARPLGREAEWYRRNEHHLPRNGPLAATEELLLLRLNSNLRLGDSLLSTEPGRTSINHAPLPVIASLPGIGPEILERLRTRRSREEVVDNLAGLADGVSSSARNALFARFAELSEVATTEPEAWILTVSATDGAPPVAAILELRLARGDRRVAVTRRRSW
jgi:type II secretory pathway component PulK